MITFEELQDLNAALTAEIGRLTRRCDELARDRRSMAEVIAGLSRELTEATS